MSVDGGAVVPAYPAAWRHRHLLDLERLTADELTLLLDAAEQLQNAFAAKREKLTLLRGCTIANVFFENSTRTRNSFSLAARRLGADTIEFSSGGSSVAKGETFI